MTTKKTALAKKKPELLALDQALKLLEAAKKPEDVKAIRDQASALQTYARQRKQSLETLNLYGEIKLRGERRIGELVLVLPKSKGGRPATKKTRSGGKGVSKSAALMAEGVPASRAREWQKLAGIPKDDFEGYIQGARADEREITTAGALRLVGGRVSKGSGEVELFLPDEYVAAVREALGTIDLDPASSAKANERIGAAKYFDEEQHGLDKPWPGRVYLFPPRGDGVGAWIDHLLAEHRQETTEQAVLLVDAATERAWFRDLWRYPICFTDRKIDFLTPKGKVRQIVTGSAFVYLGAHVGRFQKAFAELGTTVTELR